MPSDGSSSKNYVGKIFSGRVWMEYLKLMGSQERERFKVFVMQRCQAGMGIC